MKNPKEEIALPLRGRKNNLTKNELLGYFAKERLGLNASIIDEVLNSFILAIPIWKKMIRMGFLSPKMQKRYLDLLDQRVNS